MANIQIPDLQQVQTEFDELSDMELETVVGGKRRVRRALRAVGIATVLVHGNPAVFPF